MTQGDMSIKLKKFQGYAVRGLEGIQAFVMGGSDFFKSVEGVIIETLYCLDSCCESLSTYKDIFCLVCKVIAGVT